MKIQNNKILITVALLICLLLSGCLIGDEAKQQFLEKEHPTWEIRLDQGNSKFLARDPSIGTVYQINFLGDDGRYNIITIFPALPRRAIVNPEK